MADSISIENLCKSFEDKVVLDNFSCNIPLGETSFVMGPSGSGKTTLLMILMGLIPYDSGTVSGLEGKRFSAVFQEDRLCENLSAINNIRLVNKDLTREDAVSMLNAIGLGGELKKPVREFSGGMKQRVSLLRALAADYDILFMDEPFHGLDIETKQAVINYFKEKTLGKTVIIVTHDINEQEMLGGKIIEIS